MAITANEAFERTTKQREAIQARAEAELAPLVARVPTAAQLVAEARAARVAVERARKVEKAKSLALVILGAIACGMLTVGTIGALAHVLTAH